MNLKLSIFLLGVLFCLFVIVTDLAEGGKANKNNGNYGNGKNNKGKTAKKHGGWKDKKRPKQVVTVEPAENEQDEESVFQAMLSQLESGVNPRKKKFGILL